MSNSNENQTIDNHKDTLLSLKKAAKFLGMSVSFLKTLKNKDAIQFYRIGHVYRLKVSDLRAYLQSCKVNPQEGEADNATR